MTMMLDSMAIVMRILFVLVISFFFLATPGEARSLKGGVSLDEQHHKPDLKELTPKYVPENSGVTKEGKVEKPDWILGDVFTNEDMYMYSYWQLLPLKKKFKWKIPTYKTTNMNFSNSVVKHWKGFMPRNAGKVTVEPINKSERYRFYHRNPNGPSGYFERAGKTKDGFHRYRIWFNNIEY